MQESDFDVSDIDEIFSPRHRSPWSRIRPPYTGSSADTVFGVSIYGSKHYEKLWFRYTFRMYHRFLGKLDDLWAFWYYRFVNPVHVVQTGLRPGWYDADEVMFQACFATLGRFVEKELGKATEDDVDDESEYRGYRLHSVSGTDEKAIDLWMWFKDELPILLKAYVDDITECYSGERKTTSVGDGLTQIIDFGQVREPKYKFDYPETVKEEKLRELIELRRCLWT